MRVRVMAGTGPAIAPEGEVFTDTGSRGDGPRAPQSGATGEAGFVPATHEADVESLAERILWEGLEPGDLLEKAQASGAGPDAPLPAEGAALVEPASPDAGQAARLELHTHPLVEEARGLAAGSVAAGA